MNRRVAREVGAEIRRRREAMCLTLVGLAHFAEIHPFYLSKIEKGRVDVGLGVLRKIAVALGCKLGELFGPPPKISERALAFGRRFDAADPGLQAPLLALLRHFARKPRGRRHS